MQRLIWCLILLCGWVDGCSRTERPQVVVFAAASLTEAMAALEAQYEAMHPEVDVRLAFAGSQALRLQIEQGAPADVFVSANQAHTDALQRAGLIESVRICAHNRLALITPPDNPAGIETFQDLPAARRLVIGAPTAPIGHYSRALLNGARARFGSAFADQVERHIVSEEAHVRLVRAKVELGEADAALVYQTDVHSGVHTIPVPADLNVQARYALARVIRRDQGAHPSAFIDFVHSPRGQSILQAHGFQPP